jgi:hypothetical protein
VRRHRGCGHRTIRPRRGRVRRPRRLPTGSRRRRASASGHHEQQRQARLVHTHKTPLCDPTLHTPSTPEPAAPTPSIAPQRYLAPHRAYERAVTERGAPGMGARARRSWDVGFA